MIFTYPENTNIIVDCIMYTYTNHLNILICFIKFYEVKYINLIVHNRYNYFKLIISILYLCKLYTTHKKERYDLLHIQLFKYIQNCLDTFDKIKKNIYVICVV